MVEMKFAHWYERNEFAPLAPANGLAYSAAERREIAKQLPLFNCTDCGENVARLGEYQFMLQDDVWQQTVQEKPAEKLCVGCLEARLGRRLNRGDFDLRSPISRRGEQSERLRSRMLASPIGEANQADDVEVRRPEQRNASFDDEIEFRIGDTGVLKAAKNKYAPTDWSVVETLTDPDYRRQGIASRLIDKMLATLSGTIGAQCSNDASVELFWKKGFRIDGTLQDAFALRREWSSVNLIYDRSRGGMTTPNIGEVSQQSLWQVQSNKWQTTNSRLQAARTRNQKALRPGGGGKSAQDAPPPQAPAPQAAPPQKS